MKGVSRQQKFWPKRCGLSELHAHTGCRRYKILGYAVAQMSNDEIIYRPQNISH